MDKFQIDIISLLREDSRLSHAKIAVMLGANEKEVTSAIAELERSGIIVKYTAIINSEKVDCDKVEALIEVKVSPMHTKGFDSIAEDIYQFKEVKSLYLMSGAYDLAVFISGKTLREVASFVSEKLSVMDKVLSTATHFILKNYKTEGIIIDDKSQKRIVVHP